MKSIEEVVQEIKNTMTEDELNKFEYIRVTDPKTNSETAVLNTDFKTDKYIYSSLYQRSRKKNLVIETNTQDNLKDFNVYILQDEPDQSFLVIKLKNGKSRIAVIHNDLTTYKNNIKKENFSQLAKISNINEEDLFNEIISKLSEAIK